MVDEPVIDRLRHLIAVNRNAETGYLSAADKIKNSELETSFSNYARQHAQFAAELNAEIERRGADPATETKSGSMHRSWLNLKAALTGHSAGGLLSECEDGEQNAESAYLDAMEDISSGQTHTLLQKQCEKIKSFRARLGRLMGEIKDGTEFQRNE